MPEAAPPEGFAKAAASLRSQASRATDPEMQAALLASAERFDEVHATAVITFEQNKQAIIRAEAYLAEARTARWRRRLVLALVLSLFAAAAVLHLYRG
jgi:hypothetical protein